MLINLNFLASKTEGNLSSVNGLNIRITVTSLGAVACSSPVLIDLHGLSLLSFNSEHAGVVSLGSVLNLTSEDHCLSHSLEIETIFFLIP